MKIKIRDAKTGADKIVDAEVVPYNTEQELFNVYTPNVPPDHALYGKSVKVKLVVKHIYYQGNDELDNPICQVMWDAIVGIE